MSSTVELPLDLPELTFTASGGSTVRRSILPSGIRVLTERMPGASSATVGFWVAVGSRDEDDQTRGSTHFLEHLLFKGTRTRSAMDIAVAFDEVGGEHNALTAKEYTCYHAKVRDRDLDMALAVLADMVAASTIDPREFETERGVILEELAMADDDPGDVASERFFTAVLGDHPLGRPIGGSPQSIRAVSRDAVWDHYQEHYRAPSLVVTAAGGLDHDRVVAAVVAALGGAGWPLDDPAAPVARRATNSETDSCAGSVEVVHRPIEQASIMIGMPAIAAGDPRRATLTVLSSVLGGGMSSRLFQQIRERRGLAYSVHAFAPSYSDLGVFGMYAGCTPARAGEVAGLMLGELRAMAASGITDDELRRSRGQLAGASALALEDSDTRMSRLGRSELTLGEFVDLDEALRRIDEVTAEGVRDLAAELIEQPVSLAAVGPIDAAVFAGLVDTAASGADSGHDPQGPADHGLGDPA